MFILLYKTLLFITMCFALYISKVFEMAWSFLSPYKLSISILKTKVSREKYIPTN